RQPLHVIQLTNRRPAGVPRRPHRLRVEPHSKGFGKVFVGMALRVPVIKMLDEALTVRLWCVVLRIRRGGCAEQPAASGAPADLIRVVEGVSDLVPEDPETR